MPRKAKPARKIRQVIAQADLYRILKSIDNPQDRLALVSLPDAELSKKFSARFGLDVLVSHIHSIRRILDIKKRGEGAGDGTLNARLELIELRVAKLEERLSRTSTGISQ